MKLDVLMKNKKLKKYTYIDGNFNNLSNFNHNGVYIVYQNDDKEIVYIGSAYIQKGTERLGQYLSSKDIKGNTLGNNYAKKNNCTLEEAIKELKDKHSIKFIILNDLEADLINTVKPIYNNGGKK